MATKKTAPKKASEVTGFVVMAGQEFDALAEGTKYLSGLDGYAFPTKESAMVYVESMFEDGFAEHEFIYILEVSKASKYTLQVSEVIE